MSQRSQGTDWVAIYLVGVVLVAFLVLVGAAGHDDLGSSDSGGTGDTGGFSHSPAPPRKSRPAKPAKPAKPGAGPGEDAPAVRPSALPGGGTRIFDDNRILVAYYGTAGTGSLGVLGEASPERIVPRLLAAARPFARAGRVVQPVFELIATVAHGGPTRTGAYSADIDRAAVRRYIATAHRHGIVVVLDLQPGRADFLTVAKRWEWALRDPWVGLALDPEWRMGPHQIPGRRVGSVGAAEVNRVSAWLDALTAREHLPQKVFMLHQFRTMMIRRIEAIRTRQHLALVQHVDGFGTPGEKLATFRRVIRPGRFSLGFKLFYDEDVRRLRPVQVLRIRPRIRFVSFQ
jgi:hypothetical protein